MENKEAIMTATTSPARPTTCPITASAGWRRRVSSATRGPISAGRNPH